MVHVAAHLKDGAVLKRSVEAPRGSERSFASAGEVIEKFEKLAVHVLPRPRVERLRDAVMEVERMDDVADLARLLASG